MATQTSRKVFTSNFILCSLAQTSFGFVYYFLIPTLPIYLLRAESTETEIGVLIGILSISSMVVKPFVGKALLKIPAKTFMVAGGLLFAITSLAYLVAPPFWPFLAIRVSQGIGMALFHTASYALIAGSSAETTRAQSLSFFIMTWNISGAFGPAIGMFLMNQFNLTSLFLACFAMSLCTFFAAAKLESSPVRPQESATENGALLSVKVLPPSIISFFAFFIWGGITAFFPIYAINQGVLNPGYFFTTVAIMLILGRILGGRSMDIYGGGKIIPPCLITYILAVVTIAFSKTLPMFLVAAVLLGIGHAFLIPLLMVYALDQGGASPGPVMGTFHAMIDLGIGLGPVMMGIILRMSGYRAMFLSLALVGVMSLIYFYFFLRKRKGEMGS